MRPLGFLDHRIKCGDAIVGVGHLEDLQKGIPTEAFKSYTDEEKSTAALLRAQNKKERAQREAGASQLSLLNGQDQVKDRFGCLPAKLRPFCRDARAHGGGDRPRRRRRIRS